MGQIHKLSRRQIQIIECLDLGLSNKEISNKLDINEHTVKVHMWRLFKKLEVKSRMQALHKAYKMDYLVNQSSTSKNLFFDMYKYLKYKTASTNPSEAKELYELIQRFEMLTNH